MYAEISGKLTFLTPWYAHVRVRIRGLEMLVFRKILRTYLMDDPIHLWRPHGRSVCGVLKFSRLRILLFWGNSSIAHFLQMKECGFQSWSFFVEVIKVWTLGNIYKSVSGRAFSFLQKACLACFKKTSFPNFH